MEKIYPLTIICDRYNGTYSSGIWTAWNLEFSRIPLEISEDDVSCATWWADFGKRSIRKNKFGEKIFVGKGSTPQNAIEDLEKKIKK